MMITWKLLLKQKPSIVCLHRVGRILTLKLMPTSLVRKLGTAGSDNFERPRANRATKKGVFEMAVKVGRHLSPYGVHRHVSCPLIPCGLDS
jgi:hypothetical protein